MVNPDFKKTEKKWREFWEQHPELYRVDIITNNQIPSNPNKDQFPNCKKQTKGKKYVLVEFPYPSGSGLHIGHAFTFTGGDVYARFQRMRGYKVLFPMGWDAFGLPTENYAIKTKQKPQDVTKKNTEMFKAQMKRLAFSFDWEREINTTDPDYYKWTQWIFIQLFKQGLAYKEKMPINWCPSCKIGLANEEVVDGKCERCGEEVERRIIEQWVVRITKYADRLLEGLEKTDFVEKVKAAQINWIGKSEGARIRFKIQNPPPFGSPSFEKGGFSKTPFLQREMAEGQRDLNYLEVFTTRPDTLFGATFMVVAPEHDLVNQIVNNQISISNNQTITNDQLLNDQIKIIEEYVKNARKKSDMERTELAKEKTGVFSGLYAINPVNGKEIPIWISDFVLASYGTGAIMGVPAHDQRDHAFAKKFGLPIIPTYAKAAAGKPVDAANEAYIPSDGDVVINSKFLDSKKPKEAIETMIKWLEEKGVGERTASYHLRDWIFSRQHYWGEPIPMIFCPECAKNQNNQSPKNNNQTITNDQIINDQTKIKKYAKENGIKEEILLNNPGWFPVAEEELPVKLPEVEAYEPTSTGESPLAKMTDWVKTRCPVCGGEARRETDTMPNWAGSDWYYLAYCFADKLNKDEIAASQTPRNDVIATPESFRGKQSQEVGDVFSRSKEELDYWMPVDVYIGGDEHNTLHLLYSRFIYQFLWDLGVLPKDAPEPYYRRVSHGVILGPDNQRMSKSRGNVIIPETVADKYGVDVTRMYLMFMGPFEATMAWNEKTLMGVKRFLDKFERFCEKIVASQTPRNDEEKDAKIIINKTIDGVTRDIGQFGFNTAIAKMMKMLNKLDVIARNEETEQSRGDRHAPLAMTSEDVKTLIKLLAPFAPYTAEELWNQTRQEGDPISVHAARWPEAEEKYLVDEKVTLPVAINGKVRGQLEVESEMLENREKIFTLAKGLEVIQKWIEGKQIIKEIYVPGKMVNLVIG